MTEDFDMDRLELSEDLRALEAELAAIRYEERPSFGPELRAELSRAWLAGELRPRSSLRRNLIAAGLAALLLGGAAVPSARASLIRLIGVLDSAPIEITTPAVPDATPAQAVVDEAPLEPDPPVNDVLEAAPESTPAIVDELPVRRGPVLIAPEMIDRARSERLLQDAYPVDLQQAGVGGTVWLRLWVDAMGLPGDAEVSRSSGVRELDRVALSLVPSFVFAPAQQDGLRLGTWIQFPVLFEPDPEMLERDLRPVVDPLSLPAVPRADWWQLRDPLDLDALPAKVSMTPEQAHARAAGDDGLLQALGDPDFVQRYGPAAVILAGEGPMGISPTEWRAAVGAALEEAIARNTENPAPYLAFGRIRIRQGLRNEARSLFERGLEIAVRPGADASPWILAELHYERGSLIRDNWLASQGVGRVRAASFAAGQCPQARSSGGVESGFASAERLIAWNYLCPGELGRVLASGFEPSNSGSAGDLTLMMASYRAALEAFPAHVGANTDLLVTLAAAGRWDDVLAGARRFARVSGGNPTGVLFTGLALHRLGDPSASAHFEAALSRLPADLADELSDIGMLLDRSERSAYARLSTQGRRLREAEFWAVRDRTPGTELNERWAEHLARTTYAHFGFGDVFGDAGEVWVRFGRPDNIHIIDEGSGRLTEFWDYGSGPDITFVRWVSSRRTDLTPEGRAYVDDLGKILPQQ
jgi:TonB family protein